MKDQVALRPKQQQLSVKPGSIADFWERTNRVMNEIARRAFQLFEQRGRENGHDLEDWLQAEGELLGSVPVKIIKNNNALQILAQVPGFTSSEVSFNLENNTLTIQGSKLTKSGTLTDGATHTESKSRMIYVKQSLPVEVVPEKANATLQNGVLEINVPRLVNEPATAKTTAAAA